MYVFSDASFGTLTTTYSPSNLAVTGTYPLYVHGTTAYWFYVSDSIRYADFAANVNYSTLTISTYNNAAYSEKSSTANGSPSIGSCAVNNKFVCNFPNSDSKGIIFDISTGSLAGYLSGLGLSSNTSACCIHPLTNEKIICSTIGGALYHKAAIAAYKLPTTVTKTSANGMTATYELEVFW